MVNSLSPFGCITDLGVSCVLALSEGAPFAKSEMLAAVSSKAVLLMLGGLAQPDEIVAEHNKLNLLALSSTKSSAGSHRHFGFQFLLALLPPMVLLRVASSLCPSVRVLQVLLLCPFITLNPCVQQ